MNLFRISDFGFRIFLITVLSAIFLYGCKNRQLYTDNRLMMGTFVEVISPNQKAAGIVFAEIKRIENLFNKYNPQSDVAKLNRLGKTAVSPDTFYILKRAIELWEASGGAFDITVGPLVDLWGFTDKKYTVPKESEIKKALALVGSDKILFNNSDNVVKFKLPAMKIDLGAIAKGYALDCAVKKLEENSITSCLINLGGQIYAKGNRFGKPWKIAIQKARGKGLVTILELQNQGVATSGDYQQYFTVKDKRYCHILNPKTGYPADSGVQSVTIISQNNLDADALATAIFVLGKTKGEALAKRIPGIEVYITNGQ